MSRGTSSTLDRLMHAIHGVAAPFSCEGTFTPEAPVTFVFKDRSRFVVERAKNDFEQKTLLQPLLAHCKPAPFGDGKKTRYDQRVRDALQLKSEDFRIEGFEPGAAGILKQIEKQLLPHDSQAISAELYSVNVYTDGGHFAPHKDTPRGEDMFGTLVVCLPSQFRYGDLVLTHRGVVKRIDWSSAIRKQTSPAQLHWAAFFGDVDHQIERLLGGARITLTYLLRRGNSGSPRRDIDAGELEPRIHDAWRSLLADKSFLPSGGTLGYPCCHLYHQDRRFQVKQRPIDPQSAGMLKGRDQLVAVTSLQAGLKVRFAPHMFENCADESWLLERFPTNKEVSKLGWQVDGSELEKAIPILASSESDEGFDITWLEPPPKEPPRISDAGAKRDPDLPAAALLHSCDYCEWGYFGNESSETDFYVYAALHIEIPKFGRGIRAGTRAEKRPPAKGRTKTRSRKAKPE